MRTIRWEAAAIAGVSTSALAQRLVARYRVSASSLIAVLQRDTYVGIEGPPLAARYWQRQEANGLIAWLVWLWLLLAWPETAAHALDPRAAHG